MADFWRFELMYRTNYIPTSLKQKKQRVFNLHKFFTHITKMKSDISLYLGSQTTPPCKGEFAYS